MSEPGNMVGDNKGESEVKRKLAASVHTPGLSMAWNCGWPLRDICLPRCLEGLAFSGDGAPAPLLPRGVLTGQPMAAQTKQEARRTARATGRRGGEVGS